MYPHVAENVDRRENRVKHQLARNEMLAVDPGHPWRK